MAQSSAIPTHKVLNDWNTVFPDHPLTAEDLKKPLTFMRALFKVFDRLGVDTDAVLQPPTEKELNEHITYYRDLVPVINVMRVVNHLIKGLPHPTTININHLLSPALSTSTPILLLLHNLVLFHESRLNELEPQEEHIFAKTKIVEELEDKKNQLQEALNNQAVEKGARATRIEQFKKEIEELEEQFATEQKNRDQLRDEVEAILKENEAAEKVLEQKKAALDSLKAEKERLIALRVYDAEEIKAKAAQATQSVQEAEEKLSTLGAVIAQKENSLKLLQTKIKPYLDTANNLLEEIDKLTDEELDDLDADSKDGELQMLRMTEAELRTQLSELRTRREDDQRRRREAQDKREQERLALESAILEAEEKANKHLEFISVATERTHQLKEATKQYEQEKLTGEQHIQDMIEEHALKIREWDDAIMQLLVNYKIDIDRKLKNARK